MGPGGLGLIEELVQIETISKLGLVLLLFLLGVEFSLSSMGGARRAGGAALLGVAVCAAVGSGAGAWIGRGAGLGLFIGCFVSMSSTAVVLKCLVDFGQEGLPFGQACLVLLIAQDFILGFLLALMPVLASSGPPSPRDLLVTLSVLAAFLSGALGLGRLGLPWFLRALSGARRGSRPGAGGHAVGAEVFQLGALCLCFTVSVAADRVGLGMEVGAFIAGLMVSGSEHAQETVENVEALRNFFSALFLSSLGMLMQPVFLWKYLDILAVGFVVALVVKVLVTFAVMRVLRFPPRVSLSVAVATAQIGEFSFVLLSKALAHGLVPTKVYLLLLGTTALSLLVTPLQWRLVNLLNRPGRESRRAPEGGASRRGSRRHDPAGGDGAGAGADAMPRSASWQAPPEGRDRRGGGRAPRKSASTSETASPGGAGAAEGPGSPREGYGSDRSGRGEGEGAPLVGRAAWSGQGVLLGDSDSDVETGRLGNQRGRRRSARPRKGAGQGG